MKKTKKPLSLSAETVRALTDHETKLAAGGYPNTLLGTECTCYPSLGPECNTVGWTQCKCSAAHSNCPLC